VCFCVRACACDCLTSSSVMNEEGLKWVDQNRKSRLQNRINDDGTHLRHFHPSIETMLASVLSLFCVALSCPCPCPCLAVPSFPQQYKRRVCSCTSSKNVQFSLTPCPFPFTYFVSTSDYLLFVCLHFCT
jgi:hypothetical protein